MAGKAQEMLIKQSPMDWQSPGATYSCLLLGQPLCQLQNLQPRPLTRSLGWLSPGSQELHM